jgi:hypothetical protein
MYTQYRIMVVCPDNGENLNLVPQVKAATLPNC